MMRIIAASLLVCALTTSATHAGTVIFEPPELTLHPGDGGSFDVSVATDEMTAFDAISAIFAIDGGLRIDGFAIDPDFESLIPFQPFVEPWVFGPPRPDGIWIGAFLGEPHPGGPVATVDIVVEEYAPVGDYRIFVDGELDGLSELALGAASEHLFGQAIVHVVPEPATVTLMGLGALCLLRRRRVAARCSMIDRTQAWRPAAPRHVRPTPTTLQEKDDV